MLELLTIKELSAILKITRVTLHKLTKEGKIPSYKIGRSIRYKKEDVLKALTPTEIQPQPVQP